MNQVASKRHAVDFHDLAAMQIDEAIVNFHKRNLSGFVCATTLARAACGLLEPQLAADENIFHHMKARLGEILSITPDEAGKALNLAGNAFKHGNEKYCEIDIDPEVSARASILRAVTNYVRLTNSLSKSMREYCASVEKEAEKAV